jgi:hypothetical protein
LKLDLKLLSVTLKKDTLPETRYSKLDVVTQALRETRNRSHRTAETILLRCNVDGLGSPDLHAPRRGAV